jgi:hypothetical protein
MGTQDLRGLATQTGYAWQHMYFGEPHLIRVVRWRVRHERRQECLCVWRCCCLTDNRWKKLLRGRLGCCTAVVAENPCVLLLLIMCLALQQRCWLLSQVLRQHRPRRRPRLLLLVMLLLLLLLLKLLLKTCCAGGSRTHWHWHIQRSLHGARAASLHACARRRAPAALLSLRSSLLRRTRPGQAPPCALMMRGGCAHAYMHVIPMQSTVDRFRCLAARSRPLKISCSG